VISSIAHFLRYFDAVNRRAVRDVTSLPPQAETWKPPAGEGESAWDIGQIVFHMASSRMFFGQAFAAGGWEARPFPLEARSREQWAAILDASAARLRELIQALPDARLREKVPMMDGSGREMSAWRLLMMMLEHDVHHRSQIDTYAGLEQWPVHQIFGRTAEEVALGAPPRTEG
jgi:uncharacterized damage-inducible protein DinB